MPFYFLFTVCFISSSLKSLLDRTYKNKIIVVVFSWLFPDVIPSAPKKDIFLPFFYYFSLTIALTTPFCVWPIVMWETLSFFCPWVLLTFSKHRPVPRVTPATQEAPTCLFTQQGAIQYCCAFWDMVFFCSSLHNLLNGTPENSLCRWTLVFLNVYSLSFSCTL